MNRWYIVGWGLLVLVLFNINYMKKQQLLTTGERLLLQLAPVDPRSLMQGDYMTLDYAVVRERRGELPAEDGKLVVKRDAQGIATWQRLDDGSPLEPDNFLLRYRVREERLRLGAEAFFFEEGHAEDYEKAAYGELVVDKAGNSILVGLRDKDLVPLLTQPKEVEDPQGLEEGPKQPE